jgi:hypothetical protein
MLTRQALRERGWTDMAIARFLSEPDATKANPRYRSASPMKLYDLQRVAAIENTPAFIAWRTSAAPRKASAARAQQTRARQTEEWVASLPAPRIPRYSKDHLYRLAAVHYNALWSGRGDTDRVAFHKTDDPAFLNRIAANFLRHEQTDYEARLLQSRGRVGAAEARVAIREKIMTAIAAAYPWLNADH